MSRRRSSNPHSSTTRRAAGGVCSTPSSSAPRRRRRRDRLRGIARGHPRSGPVGEELAGAIADGLRPLSAESISIPVELLQVRIVAERLQFPDPKDPALVDGRTTLTTRLRLGGSVVAHEVIEDVELPSFEGRGAVLDLDRVLYEGVVQSGERLLLEVAAGAAGPGSSVRNEFDSAPCSAAIRPPGSAFTNRASNSRGGSGSASSAPTAGPSQTSCREEAPRAVDSRVIPQAVRPRRRRVVPRPGRVPARRVLDRLAALGLHAGLLRAPGPHRPVAAQTGGRLHRGGPAWAGRGAARHHRPASRLLSEHRRLTCRCAGAPELRPLPARRLRARELR